MKKNQLFYLLGAIFLFMSVISYFNGTVLQVCIYVFLGGLTMLYGIKNKRKP